MKKKKRILPELPVTDKSIVWLIFSLLLSMSWHIPHTPIWAIAEALAICYWRYVIMVKKKKLPAKWVRVFLSFVVFAGIYITYGKFLGRDPGTTTLILFSTIKLLELGNQRDYMFTIYLCYFLIFTNFLFAQTIPSLLFMLLSVIVINSTIIRFNHPDGEPIKIRVLLKSAFMIFLQAIPIMLLLFFFFPRTSGPLWNLPQDAKDQYKSGFNDSMHPGQVASLANSTQPAFRVEFPDDNMPAQKDLYFRGLVLWFTNGRGWYQGYIRSRYYRYQGTDATGIQQRITLEPHYKRWLFTLDKPIVMPRGTRKLPGDIFQTRGLVEKHIRYSVVSRLPEASTEPIDPYVKLWALGIPRRINPRLKELAETWIQQSTDVLELIKIAEKYYKDNEFEYTLKPGKMNRGDPTGDFLFNKRKGFCEHFASSFTILMRLAGIPARVVIGYQGGIYNPVGGYLLVRQADAHAWSEVWIDGFGWKRVDPTAFVSPERVEYGADVSQSLTSRDRLSESDRSDAIRRALSKGFLKKIFETLEYYWDNINNNWNLWIMSYDRYRQRDFLENLGIRDINWMAMLLGIVFIIFILLFIISLVLKRRNTYSTPILKIYAAFCKKLRKSGLQMYIWEGPLDLKRRAAEAFPKHTPQINKIITLFVQLRYGKQEITKVSLKRLKRLVRQFHL
jgi:transglutaminase-like putative cysteine protease